MVIYRSTIHAKTLYQHARGPHDRTNFTALTFAIHLYFWIDFLIRKRNDIVLIHVILCIFEAPLTDMWCNFTTCQFNLTTMYAWVSYTVLSSFD